MQRRGHGHFHSSRSSILRCPQSLYVKVNAWLCYSAAGCYVKCVWACMCVCIGCQFTVGCMFTVSTCLLNMICMSLPLMLHVCKSFAVCVSSIYSWHVTAVFMCLMYTQFTQEDLLFKFKLIFILKSVILNTLYSWLSIIFHFQEPKAKTLHKE